jgi:hypothetical protein
MCTLDKSHTRLMTYLNTREINSMLDYDTLDIGMLGITASPHYDIQHMTFSIKIDTQHK